MFCVFVEKMVVVPQRNPGLFPGEAGAEAPGYWSTGEDNLNVSTNSSKQTYDL